MEKIVFSKQQMALIKMYADRAKVKVDDVVQRIIDGKTTITEIKAGVLGIKVG